MCCLKNSWCLFVGFACMNACEFCKLLFHLSHDECTAFEGNCRYHSKGIKKDGGRRCAESSSQTTCSKATTLVAWLRSAALRDKGFYLLLKICVDKFSGYLLCASTFDEKNTQTHLAIFLVRKENPRSPNTRNVCLSIYFLDASETKAIQWKTLETERPNSSWFGYKRSPIYSIYSYPSYLWYSIIRR